MRDDDDAVRELFAPLREPGTVDDRHVRDVRTAASRRERDRPRRRRPLVAGISGTVVVAVSVIAITAFERGHPGTFVGEAGARELLSAAADATRRNPAPAGWRWSRTVSVQRLALEGRRCSSCSVERAVLETEWVRDVWSGPRGESYQDGRMRPPRAIENEPLLRSAGVLASLRGDDSGPGTHVLPASSGKPTIIDDAGFGVSGVVADPQVVPREPDALVRWVKGRLAARQRAWAVQAAAGLGNRTSTLSPATERSWALIDLATSPQLSGEQQAAAFEALAESSRVTVVDLPPAFAAANRVAVRIPAVPRSRDAGGMPPGLLADRVIVFDRSTHQVIAEETREPNRGLAPRLYFGSGTRKRRLRGIGGGSNEARYIPAVDVAGPGLDASGTRLFDPTRAVDIERDGNSVRWHERQDAERRKRADRARVPARPPASRSGAADRTE